VFEEVEPRKAPPWRRDCMATVHFARPRNKITKKRRRSYVFFLAQALFSNNQHTIREWV